MAGLTGFSEEEKIRMKRMQLQNGMSCNSIAQAINVDRHNDRQTDRQTDRHRELYRLISKAHVCVYDFCAQK